MKMIGCMATYDARKDTRIKAINSIKWQLDELHIVDNSSHEIDRADNAKFKALDWYQEPCFYFTLDDDLIYPPDYVKRTIEAIEMYGCIITHHGRLLRGTGLNYYRNHMSFHCLNEVKEAKQIDVAGTGVTAFKTNYFNPIGLSNAPDLHMSDLVFSLEASKQRKIIGVVTHKAGWIKHISNKETIHSRFKDSCARQNELADEIYKSNHGS